jgi:sugar phosphate isomerase/epimerase
MQQQSSVSRRAFLALAAAAPIAFNASLVRRAVPVGLELYTVRDELTKDLMGTVRAVARMGYTVVEFYAPYFGWTTDQAREVRKLLDDLGVKCHSTHNNAPSFTADGLPKAIELNQILGSQYVIMASAGTVTGADGWKGVAAQLSRVADTLRPLGMATGYHNHQPEWQPVNGQRPMDILAANTPKDVVLQFDVGTCLEVGADPIAWIRSNPGRIKSVHCKDWSPGPGPGKGYGVLFGEGDAPWTKIFDAAETVGGVEYYLIEQEAGPTTEELQRAEKCLANWKKLRG